MDLMEGTATAVIKAPEDVKRKQCEILESCCGSDGIPSLEKVFGIHVILGKRAGVYLLGCGLPAENGGRFV